MANDNDNGTVSHQGEDTVGAPVHPAVLTVPAPTASEAVVEGSNGTIPVEVFSKLKEHPGLLDVMTRAMNGEPVNAQEVHAALTQAGVAAPGAPARVPRRPTNLASPEEPRRRAVVTPTPPQERRTQPAAPPTGVPPVDALTPEAIVALLEPVPLDFLLSLIGFRLGTALTQMMPGCHLSITLTEEGVHAVLLLPPDPEVDEDEPFALANVQGEPDQLGEVCSTAFEVADAALQKIRTEGL